ncbi:flavodoxin [Sulfurospirillum arcachonense]|uniref:flavodoxin n=1 Tax=Sulfurospirillum arcachonense TaxID=57666 RepID=UPI000468CA17|nr:flavodoxin [Sulfurospirillum arcachonense]
MRIGIIYGSSGGTTQDIATQIKETLGIEANLIDIADSSKETFDTYEKFIIGTSTWGEGDLQDDWDDNLEVYKSIDFNGKSVAFFGVGDQENYYDSFVDGMGILYEIAKENGATIIGDNWSKDGYEFDESKAIVDDSFVGLVIDEDNQSDQTMQRIETWIETIKHNF